HSPPSPTTSVFSSLFFYTHPATTYIYTLSLHDALPILSSMMRSSSAPSDGDMASRTLSKACVFNSIGPLTSKATRIIQQSPLPTDRKSTRLNSSHVSISYAVFCLKKKKNYLYVNTIPEPRASKLVTYVVTPVIECHSDPHTSATTHYTAYPFPNHSPLTTYSHSIS